MIYEYFRATGACEGVQCPSDPFSRRLQDDNVQDFDTKWDQALLAASAIPTKMVLEDLCKSNCRILFSVRLFWLCVNKRIFEPTNIRALPD